MASVHGGSSHGGSASSVGSQNETSGKETEKETSAFWLGVFGVLYTVSKERQTSWVFFCTKYTLVAEEAFSQKLHSIGSRAEYDSLVKSGAPLVVDFYAPWCGKCRSLAPFLDTLVDRFPNVKFVKFDTTSEALKGVSSELGVKVLPTFKFFKGGKEAAEQVAGYKKKPLEDSVAELAA